MTVQLTPEAQTKFAKAIELLATIGTTPAEIAAIAFAKDLVDLCGPDGIWDDEPPTHDTLTNFVCEEAYEQVRYDVENAYAFITGLTA
jgi:hypothetical protein